MRYTSLKDFLTRSGKILANSPVALIFVEDEIEVASTLRHHLDAGFATVLVFMPTTFDLPDDLSPLLHRIDTDTLAPDILTSTVNSLIKSAPGTWFFYCYNAEYLFYPFCESRTVAEMLAFHTEERRDAMLCYVIDLYAGDLDLYPNAVSIEDAHLDKSGYYALARYEEHVPAPRRKIDRIALFRAKAGLELREDHTFNDEEYNTFACPWHHNITAAVCSFRTAKALKSNPGSTFDIHNFRWHNATPFEWHSRQLLDLGLMEPGQWF